MTEPIAEPPTPISPPVATAGRTRIPLRLSDGTVLVVTTTADEVNVLVSGPGDSVLIPVIALLTPQHETGPARDAVRYVGNTPQEQEEDDGHTDGVDRTGA